MILDQISPLEPGIDCVSDSKSSHSLKSAIELRLWQVMRKKLVHDLKAAEKDILGFVPLATGCSSREASSNEIILDSSGSNLAPWTSNMYPRQVTLFDESDNDNDEEIFDEPKSDEFDDLLDREAFIDDNGLSDDEYDAFCLDEEDFEELDIMSLTHKSGPSLIDKGCQAVDVPHCFSQTEDRDADMLFETNTPCKAAEMWYPPNANGIRTAEDTSHDELLDDAEQLSESLLSDGEDLCNVYFSSQSTIAEEHDMLDSF